MGAQHVGGGSAFPSPMSGVGVVEQDRVGAPVGQGQLPSEIGVAFPDELNTTGTKRVVVTVPSGIETSSVLIASPAGARLPLAELEATLRNTLLSLGSVGAVH